jgi:hypothetical protein
MGSPTTEHAEEARVASGGAGPQGLRLAARLDSVLLFRRLVGDEELAVRALEAEGALGLADQLGVERLAAVGAVDGEGFARVGRSRHPDQG